MRIHSLRFAALGPFAGEEVIDFDALGPSALFLIDGPTGAGKSTIIDAIVFALYGDVAGEASDKERLRSALASPAVESFAELDFSTVAGRFRVRRTPAYERAKKRGTGTTAESATVLVWRSVGERTWEPLSARHGEADAEIARAIGLSRGQFLQTVVLPQGEFATFLRSESADRLPILERIFATEVYSRIQSEFDDERRAALRSREQSLAALHSARDVLRGQLEGQAVTIDHGHELEGWALERESTLARLRSSAESTAAETAACEVALAEANSVMERFVAAEQAAKAISLAHGRLEQAQARIKEFEAQLSGDTEPMPDDCASVDSMIAELDAELESCAAESPVEDALVTLRQQAAAAAVRADRLANSIAELERDRDDVIPHRMSAQVAALRGEVARGAEAVSAREREVGELRAARIVGLAGELALTLTDGEPCPVCGAREHPVPAPVRPDHVSAELVERHEQLLLSEREEFEGLRTSVAVLSASIPDSDEQATPTDQSRAELIDALQADLDTLASIGTQIAQLRSQQAAAESTRDDLLARIAVDQQRVLVARGEFETVADRVSAIRARRFVLANVREGLVIRLQAEAHLAEVMSDSPALIDQDHERQAATSARNHANAAAQRAAAASTAAARLLQVVSELCAKVDAAQEAHEAVVRDSAATIRLAQALSGAGGQSLSAYVVQRAFDEVVEAANARLAAMLGGHFRLVTTQERTGSRRTGLGLGLKVRDLRTDTERRTTTLSGGESFCASLALALGLADCVRAHAGGIEIGMLFIDEGFGALDVERLGDVMAELLRLRADGRTVGVISHVTEMKRAIPERVDVLPGVAGSTLSVRWMD